MLWKITDLYCCFRSLEMESNRFLNSAIQSLLKKNIKSTRVFKITYPILINRKIQGIQNRLNGEYFLKQHGELFVKTGTKSLITSVVFQHNRQNCVYNDNTFFYITKPYYKS